jgi:probable rRNA maturation factor
MAAAAQIAGDLAISVPTALRQATEQGHPLSTEVKVLILHGLLHLDGYDHEIDNGKMARREQVLRARLRLPKGLIERATAPSPSPTNKKPGTTTKLGAPFQKPGAPAKKLGAPSSRRTSAARVGKQKPNTAQPPAKSTSPKAARP